jgi:hypothetical protein
MHLDILGELALVPVLQRGAERFGAVVDALRGLQDFLRRLFNGVDRCAELAGSARHAPVLALAKKRGEVFLVGGDRLAHQSELALERVDGGFDCFFAPLGQQAQLVVFVHRLPWRRGVLQRRGHAAVGEHLFDRENPALHADVPAAQPSPCIAAAINAALRMGMRTIPAPWA